MTHFEWKSGYMGTVDYIVTDETGTFRASLRHALGDYERSVLNPHAGENYPAQVESEIGILRLAFATIAAKSCPKRLQRSTRGAPQNMSGKWRICGRTLNAMARNLTNHGFNRLSRFMPDDGQ